MADVLIRVIQTGNVCRVIPPTAIAKKGADTVTWSNRTNGRIEVFFRALIFDTAPISIPINQGDSATKNVLGGSPEGLFPYSIYCYATNNNAIGNSDPEIIIEP
jgi:hypothetical protein